MEEDFLDVTEGSKKIGIILTLFIIVIIVLGYFFIYKNFRFDLRTIEVELGDTLSDNVEDYLKGKVQNPHAYKLNLSDVKVDEPGTYTYTVTYNKIKKKGKIKISDTTPPEFTTRDITIEKGAEDFYLGSFLETCEDVSKPCLVTLKNDKDEKYLNEIGTHKLDIVISDLYGNKVDARVNLTVVEAGSIVDEKAKDLEYASNSKDLDSIEEKMYISLEVALAPKSEDANTEISNISKIDLEKYVSTNYEGYKLAGSEIIEVYNKHSYIIGYIIELKITNGTEKIVYVDRSKVQSTEVTPSSEETEEEKEE